MGFTVSIELDRDFCRQCETQLGYTPTQWLGYVAHRMAWHLQVSMSGLCLWYVPLDEAAAQRQTGDLLRIFAQGFSVDTDSVVEYRVQQADDGKEFKDNYAVPTLASSAPYRAMLAANNTLTAMPDYRQLADSSLAQAAPADKAGAKSSLLSVKEELDQLSGETVSGDEFEQWLDDLFAEDTQNDNDDDRDEADASPEPTDIDGHRAALLTSLRKRMQSLVGCEAFRHLVGEIIDMARYTYNSPRAAILERQHYLFAMNEGSDAEGNIRLLADALSYAGAWEGKPVRCVTMQLPEELDDKNKSLTDECDAVLSCRHTTLFFVKMDTWMDRCRSRGFVRLLHAFSHATKCAAVFCIPYVEQDSIEKVHSAMSDILSARVVSFPPYSQEDLRRLAVDCFAQMEITVHDDAWEIFDALIRKEKSDGIFYGIDTVRKVCRDMTYAQTLSQVKSGVCDSALHKAQVQDMVHNDDDLPDAEQMLDRLVGMQRVKERLREIVTVIKQDRLYPSEEGSACVHMRFVGNPGTGKTTVARILGRLLKQEGLLRIGNFFEYKARDLIGRYVGETNPKTTMACRDAYGSVLFIDEAYGLYNRDSGNDFGKEALAALITEMENHRDDMVVILAGYTDEINEMLEGNPGLRSRVPYEVCFENFSRDELYDIFVQFGRRYTLQADLLPAVKSFFDNLPDSVIQSKSFANGRFVRNLYERVRAKALTRCQMSQQPLSLCKADLDRALEDPEFHIAPEPTAHRTVGFGCK